MPVIVQCKKCKTVMEASNAKTRLWCRNCKKWVVVMIVKKDNKHVNQMER